MVKGLLFPLLVLTIWGQKQIDFSKYPDVYWPVTKQKDFPRKNIIQSLNKNRIQGRGRSNRRRAILKEWVKGMERSRKNQKTGSRKWVWNKRRGKSYLPMLLKVVEDRKTTQHPSTVLSYSSNMTTSIGSLLKPLLFFPWQCGLSQESLTSHISYTLNFLRQKYWYKMWNVCLSLKWLVWAEG